MILLDDVAIVTGAGRGLGEATCRVLAAAGATVIAVDIRPELADGVVADIRAAGGKATARRLDVSDDAQARETVGEILAEHGRLDILVNNAGTDLTVPFEELPIDVWDRVLGVNLRGPFVMSKLVFPIMRERRRGHIINVVSTAAKRAWANASAYHASKWGLLGLSHALHVEGRPRGVKVTALVAGGMRTPFLLERFPDLDPALLQDPGNVAELIRFILTLPEESVIAEVTIIPMGETSWP
jgi:NAD(P)-dependent dehydrogenase (short-subunit alcohol dehydrogenase family)